MEIPDVIAINKMDHPGARTTLEEVRSVLALDPQVARRPPVILTEAIRGEGVIEVWRTLDERRERLTADGRLEERRRRNLAGEVFAVASVQARHRLELAVASDERLGALLEAVQRREVDPLTAVEEIVATVFGAGTNATADAR